MKHLRNLAAVALIVSPLPSNGSTAEEPSSGTGSEELPDRPIYAPRPGEDVSFRYTLSTAATLDDLTLSIDGQDYSNFVGDLRLEFESVAHYEVTDRVLEHGSRKPQRLHRFYDTISGEVETRIDLGGEETYEEALSSALEGRGVLFVWNDEDEVYDAEFEKSRRRDPEHLLVALDEDMSLRRLLPTLDETDGARAPQPGDTWEVEYSDLLHIVFPGGSLGLQAEDTGEFDRESLERLESAVCEVLRERVPEWLRGESTATYRAARSEDEDVHDAITLDVDLELEADLRDLFQDWGNALLEEWDADWEFVFERAQLECELDGEGELTWSRAAGHLEQFEFSGAHETDLDLVVDLRFRETTYRIELEFSFHGTWDTAVELQ